VLHVKIVLHVKTISHVQHVIKPVPLTTGTC